MQFFTSAGAAACGGSPRATAPIITDATLAIAAAAGSVVTNLFAGVTADPAPYGGFVTKSLGCDAVKLEVTYLDGADCDSCTTDTLTTVVKTITVPADANGVQLPPGYITLITAQVVDSVGAAKNSAAGGSVRYTSSRAGSCGAEVLVP